jgi:flagellar hook-associated protein 3 FlgL
MQRVTKGMMVSNMVRTLSDRMRDLSTSQNQVASSKRVMYASDDPVAAGLILELRNRIQQNGQFQDNADNATAWLGATDSTLQQLNDLLIQARTDATEGANGTLSSDEMMTLANNVNGYLENILSQANSEFGGKQLFGGTNTTDPAFTATRDPENNNWITAVAPNQEGISGQILRQVGNETLQINIAGNELFQPNGAGGAQDIFQVLIDLRDHLALGESGAVGDCLALIDEVMGNVSDSTALVGSQVNSLTSLQDLLVAQKTNLESELSNQEDVDLISMMTQLTMQQNAYQVALNVSSMVMQQKSLADFL